MARRPVRMAKWLVSGPPLVYLVVFFAIPALIMVLASFRTPGEFGGLAPLIDEAGKLDVDLDSYRRFFTETVYLQVFVKSAWYAALTTLICLLLAYPLATLIAKSPRKYRDILLLLVILPFWSNFLIRVYAWMIILGPNAALARAVNGTLAWFGAEPVPLLFSAFAVLVCLVYVHLPFMVLPLYANLEKHDQALLDAAQDLGANGWQRFWRITLPLLSPSTFFVVVISLINGFQVFDQVFVMTGGGPAGSSQVVVGQIYDLTFRYGRAGQASALSWLLFALILIITAVQVRGQKRWVHYA